MLKTLKYLKRLFTAPLDKLDNLDSEHLDYQRLPVLSGSELILFLRQTNRIRSIKHRVMLDPIRFEKMYLEPIHRFCELAQLAPASQAYHHTFAGGLIIHTLSVVENAIIERQKHTLPLASDPEIIETQRNLWTYAAFMAALCHDVGKTVTMVTFVDSQKKEPLNIMEGSLCQQAVKQYRIQFKPTEYYQLHQSMGVCFLHQLFDAKSLAFASEHLDVFAEVLAYINNDKYEWGTIGEIVQTADMLSTSEALKIANNTSRKFPGATLENFGERIMRTLRLVLNNTSIPKNRGGATFWTEKNYTYAVAKPFAELIRAEMQKMGATDVPSDNTRIFDELQQQGFCETNKDGQAIFRIEIRTDNFQQTFTCIKLLNKRLYSSGKQPQPLAGSIVEIIHVAASNSPTTDTVSENSAADTVQSIAATSSEITIEKASTTETAFTNTTTETDAPFPQTPESNVSTATTASNDPFNTHQQSTPEADSIIDEMMEDDLMKPVAKNSVKQPSEPTSAPNSPEETVTLFFNYIVKAINSKEYLINRDSPIYIVEYKNKKHLALLSPIVFAVFAKAQNYVKSIDGREATIEAAKPIQKCFHQTKTNVGIAGKQVHIYVKINSPSAKPPRLNFYLIPVEKISNNELKEIVESMGYSDQIKRLFAER